MGEYAVVRRVCFKEYERVIAVSDLHGDYTGFEAMLRHIDFSAKDALVIVGDILERGCESLKLLKRVKQLADNGSVYMVCGNNDTILTRFISGKIPSAQMLGYMQSRKCSIVSEMASELAVSCDSEADVSMLRERIAAHYQEEICFLGGLPHILESENAIFVHAGIRPGSLVEQEASYCLTAQAFSQQGFSFEKPVVVGHWPTGNYCTERLDVGIHVNRTGSIYSIDGGNSMKRWGQINILMMRADGHMSFDVYDPCARIRILRTQDAESEPMSLTFPNTKVELLDTTGDKTRCYVPCLGKEMTFDSGRVYEYKGEIYCSDFTTYHLPVQEGEIVSYCGAYEDGILIKRQGIVGKYCGQYEYV